MRRLPENESHSGRKFRDGLSAWATVGKARPTLRWRGALLTPAPCTEFDSPRVWGAAEESEPGTDAESPSHLYWADSLRGESAYLLRKYAPASAACRRPRPLATNASRLLNARALHRVRFSAVRGSVDARQGRLKFDKHRICFGLGLCAENPRICSANPHRLRPAAAALARGLKTLTRFLYARALHRVRFSAVRANNKKAGRY